MKTSVEIKSDSLMCMYEFACKMCTEVKPEASVVKSLEKPERETEGTPKIPGGASSKVTSRTNKKAKKKQQFFILIPAGAFLFSLQVFPMNS